MVGILAKQDGSGKPKKCRGICKHRFGKLISARPNAVFKSECIALICLGCQPMRQSIRNCRRILKELEKGKKSKKYCKVKGKKMKNFQVKKTGKNEATLCVNSETYNIQLRSSFASVFGAYGR